MAAEALIQEACGAAGDVDVLAHQVGIDARDEVLGVEIDVLDAAVQLGGDVVAQPFGVQADLEVAQRTDAGTAALAHLLAADGDEAVHEDAVRHLAATELQHRRPEQRVEGDDVLADEMDLLQIGVGQVGVEIDAVRIQQVLQRGQIAHRRVEPDVEILARRVGDLDAEIGRVTADVPVGQAALPVVLLDKPFLDLVGHLALQPAVLRPGFEEFDAARVGQLEEEVLAALQHRHRAAQRGVRILQFGGGVHRAAVLAVVAVLVQGAALRALALDVAVGQEHALHRVEELLDGARGDQIVGAQGAVDVLRQLMVLRRVRAVPVVEGDVEAVEVFLAPGGDLGDEGLRRLAGLLRRDHDRRAMRIVGTDEIHLGAHQPLETHPDVGLDVLHHVADVERRVGVGQRGRDEELAGHAVA